MRFSAFHRRPYRDVPLAVDVFRSYFTTLDPFVFFDLNDDDDDDDDDDARVGDASSSPCLLFLLLLRLLLSSSRARARGDEQGGDGHGGTRRTCRQNPVNAKRLLFCLLFCLLLRARRRPRRTRRRSKKTEPRRVFEKRSGRRLPARVSRGMGGSGMFDPFYARRRPFDEKSCVKSLGFW